MNENKKKSGVLDFLNPFRGDEEPATSQSQPQQVYTQAYNPIGAKTNAGFSNPTPSYSPPAQVYNTVLADKSLVDTFVQKLQDLIDQNNQPGFDFLEFTQTLFEESKNPDANCFKMVFRIAQKMDKTLTPDKLLQSSSFYKTLVQQTADSEISKGQNKKITLQSDKDKEAQSLQQAQANAQAQIQKLNEQILELQNQANVASNQLSVIGQKYNDQFIDIDTKLNAITTAKEQVISSIVDIESGIKNNLK